MPQHSIRWLRFSNALRNPIWLLPALLARADAALATGNIAGGARDLERAVSLLDKQSKSIASRPLRASLLDAGRRGFDRLVMLRVMSGLPLQALYAVERARVSLAPTAPAQPGGIGKQFVAPPGQIIVDYTVIGDTLLVWTISNRTVRLTRTTLDRTQLMRTIDRTRASLELRAGGGPSRRDLSLLYEQLMRPIQSQLDQPGATLVLITDGELANVPFQALYDGANERYLIEQHPVRFANTLRDALALARAHKPPRRALLIADPAFDTRSFPELRRLPGAAAEVAPLAAQYAGATVLTGAAANGVALRAALDHADVVHYAGHAVFDDARPDQSFLVLARPVENGTPDRLTAADVERLGLRHVRLVVLSACETIHAWAGRSAGFAGLAGALMSAGVGGVVGSLWRVDDSLTQELMIEFHRAYRQSGNATDALRSAQLRLLRSSDPALRSPAVWAAFRYAGN